jgi:uncharacterized membrane protein YkoI
MFRMIAVTVALTASAAVAGAQSTYKSAAKPATTTAKPTPQAMSSTKHHPAARKAETQAQLRKEAKISEETARATALGQVPNGTVKSSELEREHGKLIYSFDITAPGKTGIEEVNVNAIDGTVVAKQHESPKTEKKEAAQEKKAKK